MIVLTIVTCLMCSVNTNPRTELSVFFPTMADCLIIQHRWEAQMDVRLISACSNNAEESK